MCGRVFGTADTNFSSPRTEKHQREDGIEPILPSQRLERAAINRAHQRGVIPRTHRDDPRADADGDDRCRPGSDQPVRRLEVWGRRRAPRPAAIIQPHIGILRDVVPHLLARSHRMAKPAPQQHPHTPGTQDEDRPLLSAVSPVVDGRRAPPGAGGAVDLRTADDCSGARTPWTPKSKVK